jgi:hypothetical protein
MVIPKTKTHMKDNRSTKRRFHLVLAACCWASLDVQAQQEVAGGQEGQDQLALSRELLNKYYESEKLLGQEQAEWRLGKELLSSRNW